MIRTYLKRKESKIKYQSTIDIPNNYKISKGFKKLVLTPADL
jgi:hypothetical protein